MSQVKARAGHRVFAAAAALALSFPLTSLVAMANAPTPLPFGHTGGGFANTGHAGLHHPFSSVQTFSNQPQHSSLLQSVQQSGALPGAAVQGVTHGLNAMFQHHRAAVHNAAAPGNSGTDVNLSSAKLAFLAGNLGNFSNLVIDVGGRQELVALNTKLTAAEYVAAQQVLTTGLQTIKLNANGAASGGTVNLDNRLLAAFDHSAGGAIGSLTIARGVQVVDSVSDLSIAGRLNNYGSIYTAASSAGSTDSISAT
ncbi:MAG: hypothetical protein JSS83_27815, partial [Cyanobacteria bacterium SZAS LIN-3]|nr:hypothetical protein [Cyanobacteria bacterium SZAS LIN-3]